MNLPALAKLNRTCIGRTTKWRKGMTVRVVEIDNDIAVIERLRRLMRSGVFPDGLPLFNRMIVAVSDLDFIEDTASSRPAVHSPDWQ